MMNTLSESLLNSSQYLLTIPEHAD